MGVVQDVVDEGQSAVKGEQEVVFLGLPMAVEM